MIECGLDGLTPLKKMRKEEYNEDKERPRNKERRRLEGYMPRVRAFESQADVDQGRGEVLQTLRRKRLIDLSTAVSCIRRFRI